MPDLKIEIGFGVKGYDEFLYLEDSYLVLTGLTQSKIDDCLKAEADEDSDFLPVEIWGAIQKFVTEFMGTLKVDYPQFEFNNEYTYGFEVLRRLH